MEAHSLQPCPSYIWSSVNIEKNLNIQLSEGFSLFSYSDCLGHLPTSLCAAKAKLELAALSSGPEMLLGAEETPGGKAPSQEQMSVSAVPL